MRAALETAAWLAALAAAAGLVWSEGAERAALERRVPVAPRELYRAIARAPEGLQVVDVRVDRGGFEDAHVPGAIPLPGCELARAPERARARLVGSAPTVLVGATGAAEETERCAGLFRSARTLAGGMEGWSDAGLPEDAGAWVPPPPEAGGCL